MNEKAKRDMPDFMLPFFGSIADVRAKRGAALAAMAAGIRRKIVLPEIILLQEGCSMNDPRPNCPDNDVLQELAAGILAPAMAEQTMLHVAECKSCGPILRQYLREFSDEQSPENIAILKELQSSKPAWQKKLVRELIGGGRRFPWLKLVPAMRSAGGGDFWRDPRARAVGRIPVTPGAKRGGGGFCGAADNHNAFAVSRTTRRITHFRWCWARRMDAGVDEVPPSLHDASGAANKNLRAGNADPRWLQIQGRALLWEATPSSLEKAEKDFEKARAEGLATPSLEIDLAASYFERDSRAEHPNLQRTLNLLSEVLSKPNLSKDDQASALFNLAIAYEKTEAWDLAVETWNKYLQVDSTSGWADEARQHLKDAQKKVSFVRQDYSDRTFFLQQKAQGTLRPEDPEQFQQKALTEWLTAALADRNSDAYHALQGLAEVFAERQDFWWRDFLKSMQPREQDAVQELVSATQNNEQGAFGDALTHSRAAMKSFKSSGNLAGELLARFQEVYASRSMMDGKECLTRAGPLIAQSAKARFAWIQAQSLLESAQCRNFQMQFAQSDADAAQSLILSKQFPVLTIRVLGIIPGMKRQQKKYEESWTRAVEGLATYWQRAYPAERLDQFYSVMLQDAEESHYPYLAEALLRHVIDIREHIANRVLSNPVRKGLLHLELANLLTSRQAKDEAQKEMQTASDILKSAADSYPGNYVVSGGVKTAEAELQRQDAEQSLATLEAMDSLVKHTQNKELALSYYRLLGGVHLKLGHLDEAGASFESAIEIADAAIKDGLSWKQLTEESYRGAVRVLLAQKKDREALDRWEQYKRRISQEKPATAGTRGKFSLAISIIPGVAAGLRQPR